MREEFQITRQGKQFVLYPGLLDAAHALGLRSIDTELLQKPTDENGLVAVVKAVVNLEDGRSFSGIGDASPDNVERSISQHLIRMAETRAKARALRDAVNVGAALFEELSNSEADTARPRERDQPPTNVATMPQRSHTTPENTERGNRKARKGQVDLLKTLAVEWRGENGVGRLENHLTKKIENLTRAEADLWIQRLTPEGKSG